MHYHASSVPALRQHASILLQDPDAIPQESAIHDLLAHARQVDARLDGWYQRLPPPFSFVTEVIEQLECLLEDAHSWHGLSHKYPSIWVGTIMNSYRVHRILVQSIVAQCLSYLLARQLPRTFSFASYKPLPFAPCTRSSPTLRPRYPHIFSNVKLDPLVRLMLRPNIRKERKRWVLRGSYSHWV